MKKIIGISSIALMAMTLFFSANMTSSKNSDFDLASLLMLNTANAENGYSCTVTSSCSFGGSVSCTGTTCERGTTWVKCNGKKTSC